MLAIVTLRMKDGRTLKKCRTTRDNLRDFFCRHKKEIRWLIADINLNRWIYDCTFGWKRQPKFKYVPNHPELWAQVK